MDDLAPHSALQGQVPARHVRLTLAVLSRVLWRLLLIIPPCPQRPPSSSGLGKRVEDGGHPGGGRAGAAPSWLAPGRWVRLHGWPSLQGEGATACCFQLWALEPEAAGKPPEPGGKWEGRGLCSELHSMSQRQTGPDLQVPLIHVTLVLSLMESL